MGNYRAFTLFELILVVALMGILAVSGLTAFYNFKSDAKRSAVDGVVGSIRDGLAIYKANDLAMNGHAGRYPDSLDENGEGAECTSCFSSVLANGVADRMWTKLDSTTYSANDDGSIRTFVYDPTKGTFSNN
jgi:prepilin-type N-terminal cleavage/methylation domain-containing protein